MCCRSGAYIINFVDFDQVNAGLFPLFVSFSMFVTKFHHDGCRNIFSICKTAKAKNSYRVSAR